jgi:1-acylglycerone phosphate reductase
VNSEQTVAQTVNTILEREGRIDILVNCATAGCVGEKVLVPACEFLLIHAVMIGPLLDLPLDSVQSVYDTNVFGILRMVQAVVPHMAKRGSGMVINVGSIAGHM